MHVWHWKHHTCEEGERGLATLAAITGKQTGSDHFHSVRQGQAHMCEQSWASEPNAWPLACQRWYPLSPTGSPVSTGSPTLALVPTWDRSPGKQEWAWVGMVSLSGYGGQGRSGPKSSRKRAAPHSCAGVRMGLYTAGNKSGSETRCQDTYVGGEWKSLWMNMQLILAHRIQHKEFLCSWPWPGTIRLLYLSQGHSWAVTSTLPQVHWVTWYGKWVFMFISACQRAGDGYV